MWNTILEDGMLEGQDFHVISEDMWRIFKL